jgi:hypothetical protein
MEEPFLPPMLVEGNIGSVTHDSRDRDDDDVPDLRPLGFSHAQSVYPKTAKIGLWIFAFPPVGSAIISPQVLQLMTWVV